ncbi:M16 family metallopeptidase [Ideonella sp. BN130291]|uniref:M16 family metallopeptidase n=1 Tax=Ideonella sp. BN130291 TaxID=3112940 RepID=UPI002E272F18|nr:pitrilysin family protein [Ideonella sp. BN130291]
MKLFIPLLLAAAATLAAPAASAKEAPAAPVLQIKPFAFTERTLANGLRVIALEDHASPTVSVQVWYHVGSKDDPSGRSGFAHLFEHLMFKSTRYMKSEQFDRLTEDVGGNNNAFTADDMTAYHEVVPSNHLETLIWAEAERMSNLNVDEPTFKSERSVVEEEYRQRVLATPYGRFFNAISPAAYTVHPYRRPGIGSIEDLEAATLQDVIAFHRTYYRPDNATLVVAGDFDAKQLQAWVDKYFAPVPKPAAPIPRVTATEPAWAQDRQAKASGPQVPLPAVALVWQAPPVTGPDTAALRVAAGLLSAGESSRLNQALVYRQRIAAQAGFEADLRAGPGLLTAYAMAAGGKPLPQVAKALQAEVLRLAQKPVSPAELNKVKTQLLTQALIERQTPHGEASALAEAAVLHGRTAKANEQLDDLQRVSAADVQRVMRRYVAQARKVTVSYTQDDKAQGAVQ